MNTENEIPQTDPKDYLPMLIILIVLIILIWNF
jgi:hypothetical protein